MNQAHLTRRELLIVLTVSLATFMSALDGTIVNIALPTISRQFNTSISMVSWVGMAYFMVLSSLIPAFGSLGDLRGFKRLFLMGFALFVLGSFLCSTAQSIGMLILFRMLQAVGAAAFPAMGPAIVSTCLPERERGMALGIVSTFLALGTAAGPVLGGYLTSNLGWQWIFLINVPIGICAIILGSAVLPGDVRRDEAFKFDYLGCALIFLAIGSLIFGLNMGQEIGWTSPVILSSILASLVFLAAFIVQERRSEHPVVDLKLFGNRDVTLANAAGLLQMMLLAGALFLFPFYLELLKHFSVDRAGIILTAPSVAMVFFGPIGGMFSDRVGGRRVCIVASVISLSAFLLFGLLSGSSSLSMILLSLILLGVGTGMFLPPSSRLILGHAGRDQQGMASSLMGALRNLGMVIGVAALETVASMTIYRQGQTTAIHETASAAVLTAAFQHAMCLGVILCIIAIMLSVMARDAKERGDQYLVGL